MTAVLVDALIRNSSGYDDIARDTITTTTTVEMVAVDYIVLSVQF